MTKIHPAIAEHALQESSRLQAENEKLREALRSIADLPIDRCSTENDYRLSAAKAIALGALSQQAEPVRSPGTEDTATMLADGSQESAPAQGERVPDEIHQMAFEEGQPAEDGDGYLFTAEEFDLFVERLLSRAARPAQTEQPAGVVMPDRREPSGDHPYLSDADHEWNAALDEVARLNAAPIAQTAPRPDPVSRDWPDGNYYCKCSVCGHQFTGHKRQLVCRLCSEQPEQSGLRAIHAIHAMILNALDRDAAEGKAVRGEMAAELRAAMAAKEA